MKRGKKFLSLIFSVAFCCLFMLFLTNNKAKALSLDAFEFSCVDKDKTGDTSCDNNSVNVYYVLNKITVNEQDALTLTDLEIPSTHIGSYDDGEIKYYPEGNVEVIASNVINSASSLNLDSLVLPSNVKIISDSAFTNIATLEELDIPVSTEQIGATIFQDGAEIYKIYLNGYSYAAFSYISISETAFSNSVVDKIICTDPDTYNYFSQDVDSTLKDADNLVVVIKYVYYQSENESNLTTVGEKEYYLGKGQTINSIFDGISIEGLEFMGWYVKLPGGYQQITLGGNVYGSPDQVSYNVYPKFRMVDLTFSISSKNNSNKTSSNEKYDGSHDLLRLSPLNVNHPLLNRAYFHKSYQWFRVYDENDERAVSTEETINLSEVDDTGKYKLVITSTYTYDTIVYTNVVSQSKQIAISKSPLYVTIDNVTKAYGTYISDEDISYNVNGLLGNDAVDTEFVSYDYQKTGKINVGVYLQKVKVNISSIKEGENEKIGNYAIVYSYGNYTVTPTIIDAFYTDTSGVNLTYGEEFVGTKVYKFTNVYGKYSEEVTVTFSKAPGTDVNEYAISGVKSVSDSNYVAKFNKELTTVKVVISPRRVTPYMSIDSYVYNGKAKSISAYYYDINNVRVDIDFSLSDASGSIDEVLEAGAYVVNLEDIKDDNYTFFSDDDKRIAFRIERATPVVNFNSYQNFTYSGSKINPYVTINNTEQRPIYRCMIGNSQGDYCVNSGSYNVVVYFPQSDNYNEYTTTSIRLDISKYIINLSPKSFSFYYDTNIDIREEIEINGETVVARYRTTAQKGYDIGKYDITGVVIENKNMNTDHPNYIGSIILSESKNKVEIVAKPVKFVYFGYTDLVYDGKVKEIGVHAVDLIEEKVVTDLVITKKCDEGIIKDAKKYHLRAYFDDERYVAVNANLLVFDIAKATYDISNLKLEDKVFTLNFKDHYIELDGELPVGVSVRYTIDGKEGNSVSSAFSHKVVAYFDIDEQNYLPIDNMEATIYIDMSWVFITIAVTIITIAISFCVALLYVRYRRLHPKKIKFKIKTLVDEDLEAKRVATSVKDVLGDEEIEHEVIEDENDILDDNVTEQNFIDRLYAADSELKYYYSEVKNEILSYDGIKHSVDRKFEVFYHGTRQIAKLSICNHVLKLYVNLDPSKYDKKQYNHRDMSKFDCHARTPLRIDVNTTESLRHAKVFIRILRKKESLKSASSFVKIDYEKFYTLKENFLPRIFKKMTSVSKKKGKK